MMFPEVMRLCPRHPFWNSLTILAALMTKYLELMKYFLRSVVTSELALGVSLPRLVLNPLL